MDAQPARPFGLVLLTALSFGFGVLGLFMAGQLYVGLQAKLDPTYLPGGMDAAILVSFRALPVWFLGFLLGASLVKAPLLLAAGWGYWNFRRLGRWLGNTYAVVSLADSVVAIVGLPFPVGPNTIIGLLFPVFTLLAVNGPFRALLTR
jgi:hypothetical protein